MLDNFRRWYLKNFNEITWFLIGWLMLAGISSFFHGDYLNAAIALFIAFVNYTFVKRS